MKICFIGLGSIGRRHIKNLAQVLRERKIKFTIDALRVGKAALDQEVQELLSHCYARYEDLPDDYDIVFVTNPTALHYLALSKIVGKTENTFIEKPLFDQVDLDLSVIEPLSNGVNYVACPLRYHPVIEFINSYIEKQKIFSVRSISSSYLPEWREGVDYRKIYSASKVQGGGVSLDLIHEWDYLTYLFGEPVAVYNFKDKVSDLEIDSDDLSIYIAKYKDKMIELHLDYFGRKAIRQISLYTAQEVVIGDLLNYKIYIESSKSTLLNLPKSDIYLIEMNHFIDLILNHLPSDNSIDRAYRTLQIALNKR